MMEGGTQFWLVKTEPSVYSIYDLKREATTSWDGVRNYQARNFLRAMKTGDRVVIYHSSVGPKGSGGPHVAGMASVITQAVPDETQFDSNSSGFDPKCSREAPRWWSPTLRFVECFETPLYRSALFGVKELEHCELLRKGSRLSVLPLTSSEFIYFLKFTSNS
jgi:predicted RNA-binding protein with PUA-like domain